MAIGLFLAGIGVLIWDQKADNYLILKRSEEKDFAAGAWECVTGRVDQGEGFEDAAHREVREELGQDVILHTILGTTHFYRGDARPDNELLGIVYLGTLRGTEPIRLSLEHSEYCWITVAEAHDLLQYQDSTKDWLLNVIDQAEVAKNLLPAAYLAARQSRSFELDVRSSGSTDV